LAKWKSNSRAFDAESSPTKGGLLNLTAQDVLEMTDEKH
jgi:hypothetical protein